MNIKKTLVIPILFLTTLAFAQQHSIQTTKPASVKTLEDKFNTLFETNKIKADSIAKITNQVLRYTSRNGDVVEFSRFAENGQMLFYKTDNIGSGRSISTNKVWPGGVVGTALTGSGLTNRLGEWDGGKVFTTHQEFAGRVTQKDGASNIITHATHVAGTMIAAGVDNNAKGMAYQATLNTYDWNNDNTEMTTAAANGLLLSNHSYGTICGWYRNTNISPARWEWWGDLSISATTDYKYGYYDQQAASWDNIAYANPYYLICKAAGNDRGMNKSSTDTTYYVRDASNNWIVGSLMNVPDAVSQYDCMEPTATAKNILTVGAVNKIGNSNLNNGWTQPSDIVMSSFSGWGPTDDGRIKPDLVAAGVSIYSTDSSKTGNSKYATLSGTSMATPAVTGSLLLVQQHYNNLKGSFMRASTLKGLAIHTADEAGNAGPDYTFGWGMLNTASAVNHISDTVRNKTEENILTNNATQTETIQSDGTKPLRITICWTDIAGNPVSPTLNSYTTMLVNDLDIRLKREADNAIFTPYILDPSNPSVAATTGDNTRDNVEQIYLATPMPGNYTVMISHKGTLSNPQVYSLLISGIGQAPTVAFTSDITSACSGQTLTFTDHSTGSSAIQQWYFPGGNPATATGAVASVTYNSAGTYPVALKVSNSLGSDSIYISDYVNVGGITLPFIETFESNSPTINSWTINNPDGDTTWQFRTVGGTSPGNTAAYINFYSYGSVGQRDALISPVINFKDYANLNLSLEHAYAKYTSTNSDSLILSISTDCGTNWTRLIGKAENGTHNFATVANQSAEFIPSQTSQWCGNTFAPCFSIDLTPWAGLDNIKLKFETYNNNSNNLFIDNINIDGTPLPPVANFGTTRTTFCAGEPIDFYDSTEHIVKEWEWTFDGASTTMSPDKNPAGIIYTTPGVYSVTLKVTNASGSDSITKTNYITIVDPVIVPTVTTSGSLNICSGDSVTLTSDLAATYQWFKDDVLIAGATDQSFVAKIAGIYKVEIENVSGCKAQSATTNVGLHISGNTHSNYNRTETYSVASTNGSTYEWTITNGTLLSGGNTNNIIVSWGVAPNGLVQVQEITNRSCRSDTVSLSVILTASVGISGVEQLTNLKVYPNPATNFIHIDFENLYQQNIEISITSLIGKKILSEQILVPAGGTSQKINTSGLNAGIYFIEVMGEKARKQLKIIIE